MSFVGRSRPQQSPTAVVRALGPLLLALGAGVAGCGDGVDLVAHGFDPDPSSTTATVFLGERSVDRPTGAAGEADVDDGGFDPEVATTPGSGAPDDESTVAPAGPTAALQANLATFGIAFLSYDYREPADARAALLASVATPELAAELSVALPLEAKRKLASEKRVVNAEFVSAIGVDESVYELTFLVAITVGDGEVLIEPEHRSIVVTVNASGLITDVR